ncbi:MAG: BatA and WFA domain-containing protein [Planctomycetota bacterium]
MNELFRNTLSPGQWAILAAVPPAILALYFLKLRRQPLEVPSTYLWSKTIEDLRVNSLWQRLRQSILLFLQLLLVALAILALLRPGWQGTDLTGQRLVFVIDNSASMSTEDAGDAGDASRLDVAKAKVEGLLDQMDRSMSAMILSFAAEPRVVQQFTSNVRLLKERLATIRPTAEATDLTGALELASGLANPAGLSVQEGAPEVEVVDPEPATLFILSDGKFADVDGFALGNLEPVYVPLGSRETGNLAITNLTSRVSETVPGARTVFLQVANYSANAADAVVELRLDGRVREAQRLSIEPGGLAGASFSLDTPGGALEATLSQVTLDKLDDRLALDDRAAIGLNDPEGGRVLLISPGNIAVEQALATARTERLGLIDSQPPSILKTAEHQRLAAAGAFDLIVYDRCVPDELPRANTVFIGAVPPGERWAPKVDAEAVADDTSEASVVAPQIIDWNRAHPLLANAELGNFDIVESRVVRSPVGGATLIDSAEGPLAAIAPRDAFEDVVIGFAILVEEDGRVQRNTEWINRHSFPTFWLNTLEYFLRDTSGNAQSVAAGQTIEITPTDPTATAVTIVGPGGVREELTRRGAQPFVWKAGSTLGVYRVLEAGEETQRFGVNLLNRVESDVRLSVGTPDDEQQAAIASVRIGNIEVAASAGAAPARQELWKPLLVAALALLAIEWWVYHRRVAL